MRQLLPQRKFILAELFKVRAAELVRDEQPGCVMLHLWCPSFPFVCLSPGNQGSSPKPAATTQADEAVQAQTPESPSAVSPEAAPAATNLASKDSKKPPRPPPPSKLATKSSTSSVDSDVAQSPKASASSSVSAAKASTDCVDNRDRYVTGPQTSEILFHLLTCILLFMAAF
mgnify:CR=1 FL=1